MRSKVGRSGQKTTSSTLLPVERNKGKAETKRKGRGSPKEQADGANLWKKVAAKSAEWPSRFVAKRQCYIEFVTSIDRCTVGRDYILTLKVDTN